MSPTGHRRTSSGLAHVAHNGETRLADLHLTTADDALEAFKTAIASSSRQPGLKDLSSVLLTIALKLSRSPNPVVQDFVARSEFEMLVVALEDQLSSIPSPIQASFRLLGNTAMSLVRLKYFEVYNRSAAGPPHPGSVLLQDVARKVQQRLDWAEDESSSNPAHGINTGHPLSIFTPADLVRLSYALVHLDDAVPESTAASATFDQGQFVWTDPSHPSGTPHTIDSLLARLVTYAHPMDFTVKQMSSLSWALACRRVPCAELLNRFAEELTASDEPPSSQQLPLLLWAFAIYRHPNASKLFTSFGPAIKEYTDVWEPASLVTVWWALTTIGMDGAVAERDVLATTAHRLRDLTPKMDGRSLERVLAGCNNALRKESNDTFIRGLQRAVCQELAVRYDL